MRIIKEYGERKNEILDTAERLFIMNGYEKCTINDIIKEISIAKGTFYHYFKSKQEVLDEIVFRYTDMIISRANKILMNSQMRPEEKLMSVFMSMRVNNQDSHGMLSEIHKPENALLHQKTWSQIVEALGPILEKVIEEGVEKGAWSCRYPLQYMQIFLASALTLTDEGVFNMNADSQKEIMVALISVLEKMLEMPEDYFLKLYIQNFG